MHYNYYSTRLLHTILAIDKSASPCTEGNVERAFASPHYQRRPSHESLAAALTKETSERRISYRVAYLLLPLQHVGNGMVPGEFDVAVEHDRLAEDGGDVDGILLSGACKWCCESVQPTVSMTNGDSPGEAIAPAAITNTCHSVAKGRRAVGGRGPPVTGRRRRCLPPWSLHVPIPLVP